MPLRALLHNATDVVAPSLSGIEWEALRRDVRDGRARLTLPCCGSIAHQRTSPRGLRHFYHPPSSRCSFAGETTAHLMGKYEIVEACRRAGYDARTEWIEDGWRADVLAVKDDVRVAFEVQLCALPLEELLARQERYRRSGVRGCWFCLYPPRELRASAVTGDLIARRDLPLFEIDHDVEHGFLVHVNGRKRPLDHLVEALIEGRIAFRETSSTQVTSAVTIGFYDVCCWRCGADVSVFRALLTRRRGVTTCGAELRWDGLGAPWPTTDRQAEMAAVARSAVATVRANGELGERLAVIRKRSSQNGLSRSMWSFACPRCGAAFHTLDLRRRPNTVATVRSMTRQPVCILWPHWCDALSSLHCAQPGQLTAEWESVSHKPVTI